MGDIIINEILIYPIKSCAFTTVNEWEIGYDGFMYDREWMIIDSSTCRFITQRQMPRMSLIQPVLQIENGYLVLNAPEMEEILVPLSGLEDNERLECGLWSDIVEGIDQGDEVAAWLTMYLESSTRLVRMPEDYKRSINEDYKEKNSFNSVAYSDRMPFTLISYTSMDHLNQRIGEDPEGPIIPICFRPNFVVTGVKDPRDELHWKKIKIGSLNFYGKLSASRCKLTTVLPTQGEFRKSNQPLQIIKESFNGTFALMLTTEKESKSQKVHVGDKIVILERVEMELE